ncbi:hypothetical protein C0Z01_13985 [Photobacterium kishitanii]|uniref:Uncharacterized protein n=1 Tax=Photobacterium kishitanii TaxID=318456 RepID=A0A2T3KDV4_9GAMM|nr:hypothetical protein [Photobacterium kishitanii]KJG10715.1 hypothetical protein UB40_04970 [Photobacterium kishitanii]OBU28922.1 hypothetical protein AYY22_12270 [Photobacterium kishitanii]PSU90615.1 hypothetical protein C0W35_17220 [Photobacterium kishitanii]PSU95064.1 hypothetical protein C9J27_18880 [Photobacterium kishitanii]PSV08046.1 hypothetical protein C0W96_01980 [Photobacterium kishitanii]
MQICSLMVVLSSLFFFGCGGDSSDDNKEIPNDIETDFPQIEPLPEPILKITDISDGYYGLLYDAGGNELKINKNQVLLLQDGLINELNSNLNEEQRAMFKELHSNFTDIKQPTDIEKVLFQNVLLDAMISSIKPQLQDKYFPPFRLFRHHTHSLFPISRLTDYQWILDLLSQRSLLSHLILIPPQETDNYIDTCRENDVPIPPDWGSTLWQYRGVANIDFLENDKTEVWAYESSTVQGSCIALPRWDIRPEEGINEISLLGIICQSKTTGKACFWDNLSKETGQRIKGGTDLTFKISDIKNGNSLGENCTRCHRGKNVFLIHPETNLDISDDYNINPDVRYQPISTQANWSNPAAHSELGDGACASCHEIGALSGGYCNILRNAANQTMPPQPEDPTNWDGAAAFYGDHIQQMINDGCPE